MWNRLAAAALCLALIAPAAADEKPYRVTLIGDGITALDVARTARRKSATMYWC